MRNLLKNQHRLLLLNDLSLFQVVLVAANYLLLNKVLRPDHLMNVGIHLTG
jgi:hypothetical protein